MDRIIADYFTQTLPAWFSRGNTTLWYNVASKRHHVPCEHIFAFYANRW